MDTSSIFADISVDLMNSEDQSVAYCVTFLRCSPMSRAIVQTHWNNIHGFGERMRGRTVFDSLLKSLQEKFLQILIVRKLGIFNFP